MSQPGNVTAAVIVIGNEILSGRTQDQNIQYIAKGLNEAGVRLTEVRVVPDVEAAIVKAVNEMRAAHDYVFTTGGIGPTHDDITAGSVAKALALPLERNARAVEIMRGMYKPEDLNESRLRMAEMPVGAELVDNSVSGIPGFRIANVFVMAGVPSVMRSMFDSVRHGLRGGAPVRSRAVATTLFEGDIAEGLSLLQARYPDVDIGSYPFYRRGKFGVTVVLRAPDDARLGEAAAELVVFLDRKGGNPSEEAAD